MIVGNREPRDPAICGLLPKFAGENLDTIANDPPDTKLPMTETHRPLM